MPEFLKICIDNEARTEIINALLDTINDINKSEESIVEIFQGSRTRRNKLNDIIEGLQKIPACTYTEFSRPS